MTSHQKEDTWMCVTSIEYVWCQLWMTPNGESNRTEMNSFVPSFSFEKKYKNYKKNYRKLIDEPQNDLK